VSERARPVQDLLMNDESDRPRHVGISHLGFSVTDLDTSISFYCDVLGAVLVRPPDDGDSPAFSGRMALVLLGSDGLDLFEHAGNQAEAFEPARTGLDHLGLVAESYEDLEKWAEWLDAHDIPRSEIRDGGGVGAMFDFTDPDGIQLEFFFRDREKLRQAPLV
jgi:glyoxylase I family protein